MMKYNGIIIIYNNNPFINFETKFINWYIYLILKYTIIEHKEHINECTCLRIAYGNHF